MQTKEYQNGSHFGIWFITFSLSEKKKSGKNKGKNFRIMMQFFSFPGRARTHTRNHSSALLHGSFDGEPQTDHVGRQRRHR